MKFLLWLCYFASALASPTREEIYPVVVLGGGIGALTSSIYLARAGLSSQIIEGKNPGGLLTQSHTVQNWPAELEIDGMALTDKIRKQAEANGAVFKNEEVVDVDFSKRPFTITTRHLSHPDQLRKIFAHSVIIAMGTQPNFLGVPGEHDYWGRGVTNCAICDGSLYKGKVVGVVGGGDAAVLEALYLSNIAKEVHVLVRKGALKAMEEKRIQALRSKPNVRFSFHTEVQVVKGDGKRLTSVTLKENDRTFDFPLDGLFLAIGSKPNTSLFQNVLDLDEKGYIRLTNQQQTSVEGVYAIGDIVDPIYKQAITAAADGAKAAMQVQQYLADQAKEASSVVEIYSQEQFEQELNVGTPVVVDFYASWCGPCKRLSPMLESFANQLSGKVKFLKVNVDTLDNLSQTYQIQAMPTVLLFDASGKETERKSGNDQIADLLHRLYRE